MRGDGGTDGGGAGFEEEFGLVHPFLGGFEVGHRKGLVLWCLRQCLVEVELDCRDAPAGDDVGRVVLLVMREVKLTIEVHSGNFLVGAPNSLAVEGQLDLDSDQLPVHVQRSPGSKKCSQGLEKESCY